MKRLLVLLVLVLVSCTPDDTPENNCGKITARGWDNMQGYFFKIDNKNEMILVSQSTYNQHQTGQAYCK